MNSENNNEVEHNEVEHNEVEHNEVEHNEVIEMSISEEQKPIIKKRGRKSKSVEMISEDVIITEPKLAKKRGRKPKGGKIITNLISNENDIVPEPNIIIHLKCGEADLVQNNFLDINSIYEPAVNQVSSFHFEQNKGLELNCHALNEHSNDYHSTSLSNKNISMFSIENNGGFLPENNYDGDKLTSSANNVNDDTKILWKKIKELTINLHMNSISDKKSACFWCTCEFDNPPIFIPKHELNNTYYCYGCFCSPECATAYLFNEPIDTSTRFERYHLLNHIYCKIYDYTKNIKPAPTPYYLLSKYYGNLTIQEFRRLLKNERLLLVVDKPLSRTLPELHEDNDDFLFKGNVIPSANKIKLRRQNKTHTKTDIISDKFSFK
jgi:hypothetical protein